MTDFIMKGENPWVFDLEVKSWPDNVVQISIVTTGITHAELASHRTTPAGPAVLATQLNPDQIRNLIDHLEPFATERESVELEATADMCGGVSMGFACAPKCCEVDKTLKTLDGTPVFTGVPSVTDDHESILQEAEKVVNGPRAVFYGPPSVNFQRIASLWDAWLLGRPNRSAPISTYDVSYMMILMKLARLQHQPYHRDSVVDIAGYAGCAEKLARDLGDS